MLEKPDLDEQKLLARLRSTYGLAASELIFLPLGADVNTAVYRAVTTNGTPYFLKLRKGSFDAITVEVPRALSAQGIQAIIPPLETLAGQLWADFAPYRMILYPFVDGVDGYEAALTDAQRVDYGAAMRRIHTVQLPEGLAARIPREDYSPRWREMAASFQAQVETTRYADPVAERLAAFMREHREEIHHIVERAGQLGRSLQEQRLEYVLCHSDIHPGNLLLSPGGSLYIVDWDNPIYAPKEHDLLFAGAGSHDARAEALFFQGYGPAVMDRTALAYYQYERIVQDVAAFCSELLLTSAGGEDREQSYGYFTSIFRPGGGLENARATEE